MRSSVVLRRTALVAGATPVLAALVLCRPTAAVGSGPDGAIVAAATWTAWLAASYLLLGVVFAAATNCRHAVTKALVPPALAAVVAAAVGVHGVVAADAAPAGGPRSKPPVPSV